MAGNAWRSNASSSVSDLMRPAYGITGTRQPQPGSLNGHLPPQNPSGRVPPIYRRAPAGSVDPPRPPGPRDNTNTVAGATPWVCPIRAERLLSKRQEALPWDLCRRPITALSGPRPRRCSARLCPGAPPHAAYHPGQRVPPRQRPGGPGRYRGQRGALPPRLLHQLRGRPGRWLGGEAWDRPASPPLFGAPYRASSHLPVGPQATLPMGPPPSTWRGAPNTPRTRPPTSGGAATSLRGAGPRSRA
jgi:hypothetical protein